MVLLLALRGEWGEKEGGVNLRTSVPEIKGIVVERETRRGGEGRGGQMEGDVTYR